MSAYSGKPDRNDLFELSQEVSRIANSLARLSSGSVSTLAEKVENTADKVEIDVEQVNKVIRLRRARARYLPDDLFAEPAWDMLLDLLRAEIMQQRVSVSDACLAAWVPTTTALRWLQNLERKGLVTRHHDPLDGRRDFVALARHVSLSLRRWFADGFNDAA